MIYNLRRRSSARIAPTPAALRGRPASVTPIWDGAAESTRDPSDELSLKLSTLEAEALGLRQRLAEATANSDALQREIDDLRRDRERWRKLAEQSGPKPSDAGQKTWFCGRVSRGA